LGDGIRELAPHLDDVAVGQHPATAVQDHGVIERAGPADEGQVAGQEQVVLVDDGLAADLGEKLDDFEVVLLGAENEVITFRQIKGNPDARYHPEDEEAGVGRQLDAK
jgi:hypothetical protein